MKRQLLILLIFTAVVLLVSFPFKSLSNSDYFVLLHDEATFHDEELLDDVYFEPINEPLDTSLMRVPVLEYHNFGSEEGRWTRTPDNFYADLMWLYNNDYRPVNVDDFVKMEFPIEEGKKPVILTFDDASEGQFRILEDGTIDPDCAIGVLNRFIQEYEDWGPASIFFILPNSFGQAEYVGDKLNYLIDTGREIGNHTFAHEDLAELDGESIQKTLASHERYVQERTGLSYKVNSLAYPYGHYPRGELFEFVEEGEFEGHKYKIDAAFLVGAHPSVMPNNPDFDPYKIPRIQAFDDEWERWFKREPGETDKSDKDPAFVPYVVSEEYSTGIAEASDLSFKISTLKDVDELLQEVDEPAQDEGIQDETAQDALSQDETSVEPDEPEFPYETCKPFDFTPTSYGKQLWKMIKYKLSIIQFNKLPEAIKYAGGRFIYKIPEDSDDHRSISQKFLKYSRHYRIPDFRNAILEANPDSGFNPEDEIIIPDIPLILLNSHIKAHNPWGIYLTGYYAVSDEGQRLIESLKQRGGNLVVFDVKEIDGYVFYPSKVPFVKETGADKHITIPNLENYVRYWHEQGIYLATRIVVFKDINLARSRPDLAIQHVDGALWTNREGSVWVDPSNEETQQYIIDLVEEIAKAGVDEIQFDYIRFPTLGPVSSAKYGFDEENMEKYEVIRNFIARVSDTLKPYDAKLSLDVYGVIAWNQGYDAKSTGQRMECLGPFIDVVYPMTYPSHFGPGFAGYDNPSDHPYYFVAESIRLFEHYLEGTDTVIRPWIQAFSWRVANYGQWYIDEQVKAATDMGIDGYALWNASNRYFNLN